MKIGNLGTGIAKPLVIHKHHVLLSFARGPLHHRRPWVGKSSQFPRECTARYAASLQPIAPRLLFQRRDIAGDQMKVTDYSKYQGKRDRGPSKLRHLSSL